LVKVHIFHTMRRSTMSEKNRTLSVRWTIIYGGSCIISFTEFHRMEYYRAFLRRSSSRSVLSTTSTNCRYIKRFVLRNFFRVQCISVKEVVWGPVETSDTVGERSKTDSYLLPFLSRLVRNIRDDLFFALTTILSTKFSFTGNCT